MFSGEEKEKKAFVETEKSSASLYQTLQHSLFVTVISI